MRQLPICYTLLMFDSWGDGWNGNMWYWEDSSGVHNSSTGTLDSGSSGTDQLCVPVGDCMKFYVTDEGSWNSEVSWYITDSSGVQQASGGSPFTGVTIGGCPYNRLRFHYTTLDSYLGDLALDRIQVSFAEVPAPTTMPTPMPIAAEAQTILSDTSDCDACCEAKTKLAAQQGSYCSAKSLTMTMDVSCVAAEAGAPRKPKSSTRSRNGRYSWKTPMIQEAPFPGGASPHPPLGQDRTRGENKTKQNPGQNPPKNPLITSNPLICPLQKKKKKKKKKRPRGGKPQVWGSLGLPFFLIFAPFGGRSPLVVPF
eukprot:FR735532.1.p1 GENE.FR735532.1~~FR735532.1.p1  ORF type:complete len:311 (+),score=52.23 FR735532.1:108-1040(+)